MHPIVAFLPLLLPVGVIVVYFIVLKILLIPGAARQQFMEILENDMEETEHITVTPYFRVVIAGIPRVSYLTYFRVFWKVTS